MVRIDKNNSTIRDSHFPLPKGWRWVRLGEVCEVVTGSTPSRQRPEFFGSGIPWLTPRDIGEEIYVYKGQEEVTKLGVSVGRARLLRKGTVLLVCIGATIGKVAIAGRDLCVNQQINALVCSNVVCPEFLYYTLIFYRRQIISLASTATLPIINQNTLRSFTIPLPPLPEQKRIAAKIQELMQEVERARAACEKQLEAAKALPAAYVRQVFESEEAKRWERRRLGEVCEINPKRPKNFTRFPEAPTTFVPMAAIDERTGIIAKPEIVPYSRVSKGYTYFEEGDVLFAKITPCMQNGKHVIAKNLIDGMGFGTTEFHVLRPHDNVLPEWIHFFIRQPHFLKEATLYFTGAVGQQRVPEEFLSNYIIPIPSLPMQERIIAELKEKMAQVDKLRASIEKQLEAINALPQAILRKAFIGEL